MNQKQLAVQRRRARLDKLKASYAAGRVPQSFGRNAQYSAKVTVYHDRQCSAYNFFVSAYYF